jgi:hypothetical protein
MHDAFFRHLRDKRGNGEPVGPAEALLRAKLDFLQNMPHGLTEPFDQAVEYKTLHEFTCLGLGW